MHNQKKQLEILLMHYFRKCCPDFPKGKIVPSESPDFILALRSRNNVGIEITRLNPANAGVIDEKRKQQIAIRNFIVKTSKLLFEDNSDFILFVKFLFSEKVVIKEKNSFLIALQIVNIIRRAIANRRDDSFFQRNIKNKALPNGVDSLLVIHHPKMKVPVWERSNNLGVSGNVIDDIEKAIEKKDEKLKLYQKKRLNYYWLLIITDRLRGINNCNLVEKIMDYKFNSLFQNVFLFDLIKSEVMPIV